MKMRKSSCLAFVLTCTAANAQTSISLIDQEQLGDAWPFTQPEMHLSCLPGKAVVVMDVDTAAMYPLNGPAKQQAQRHGMKPLEEIWRDNPEIVGAKISVSSVIERGLALCK